MLDDKIIKEEIDKGNIFLDRIEIGKNYAFVTLGDTLKVYDTPCLNVKESSPVKVIKIPKDGYILQPNILYLGRTQEYTKTYNFVPMLGGLDELATLGMEIHITAGFGDNGFEGTWTLEIICALPTKVYPNMPIGRLYYYPLIGDSSIEYKGKYLGQVDPVESRLSQEYTRRRVN